MGLLLLQSLQTQYIVRKKFIMLENLMYNPIAWTVLSLATVLSLFFGIFTWIIGKNRKEISYVKSSFSVVESDNKNISKMKVLYDENEVSSIKIKKYALWNSGNQVLNHDDVVEPQMIKITSRNSDTKILDAQILGATDESNLFKINSSNEKEIIIDFNYVARGDGCAIQILHTGHNSDININCKIKGGQQLRCINPTSKTGKRILKRIDIRKFMVGYLIFLTALVNFLGGVGILTYFNPSVKAYITSHTLHGNPVFEVIELVFIIISVICIDVFTVKYTKQFLLLDIPSKLRQHIYNSSLE